MIPPPDQDRLSRASGAAEWNTPQEDEEAQAQAQAKAQAVADAICARGAENFGLQDSVEVSSGDDSDDVQDLVDHMQDMVRSGRIDMGAYCDERNDDDEPGALGPSGEFDQVLGRGFGASQIKQAASASIAAQSRNTILVARVTDSVSIKRLRT